MSWLRRKPDDNAEAPPPQQAAGGSNPISEEEMRRRRLIRLGQGGEKKVQPSAKKVAVEPPKKVAVEKKPIEKREEPPKPKPPPKPKVVRPPVPMEQQVSSVLSRALMVSLGKDVAGYVTLSDLADEIRQEDNIAPDQPILLSADNVDRVIFECLTKQPDALNFLVSSFERADDELRRTAKAEIQSALETTKSILVVWIGPVLTTPEEFVSYQTTAGEMTIQLADRICSSEVSITLLAAIASKFEGDDEAISLEAILFPLFDVFAVRVATTPLMDSKFMSYLKGLGRLLSNKKIAQMYAQSPHFCPKDKMKEAKSIRDTLLGAVLAGDLIEEKTAEEIFPDPANMNGREVHNTLYSMREMVRVYWEYATNIFMNLFQAGPEAREATLSWIGHVLSLNEDLKKTMYDPEKVSSLGFMMNLTAVLLKVAAPFSRPNSPKLETIDPSYVLSEHRINYNDSTRLGLNTSTMERWVDKRNPNAQLQFRQVQSLLEDELRSEGRTEHAVEETITVSQTFSFVTEIFYLTGRLIELGFTAATKMYEDLLRTLRDLRTERARIEAQASFPAPSYREMYLKKLDKEFEIKLRRRFCLEIYLVKNDMMLPALIRFSAASASFLDNLFSKGAPIALPLMLPPPMRSAIQPEYIVDDIQRILTFTFHYNPEAVETCTDMVDGLLTFANVVIDSPFHVKNPYIRAQFATVLYLLAPRPDQEHGTIQETFLLSRFLQKHLMSGIFRLYVDVETTGSHSQFWEKFTSRLYLSEILLELWKFPRFIESLHETVSNNEKLVKKAINMLLNDANFLLDDSLNNLQEAHNIQVLMDNPEKWNKLTKEEQEEKQNNIHRVERTLKSTLRLASSSVKVLRAFTGDSIMRELFLRPEMVSRVAEMLNYYLQQLVGPRCKEYKIKNPEEYGWQPKLLLTEILRIYLNLHESGQFAPAVARDQRSYSESIFLSAISRARRIGELRESEIMAFMEMLDEIRRSEQMDEEEEEMFGDIPDELLDPIMSTLMRDPVTLPTSGNVCDRSVIERHLLSDPTDPFNRKALKAEQLEPNAEVKAKVDEFIASRRRE